ncbi:MAG: clostripain-related cysteine peptidase [Candidatus Eremiobacterota bacterium]
MKINNNTNIQAYTPQVSQQKPKEDGAALPQDGVTLGSSASETSAPKKWTFMHYAAGDNNLAPYIESDVDEMERIGSDANTNIVALLDLNRGKGAKTYYITQDKTPGLKSEVLENHGLVNTSDPKFLAKFIIDSVKKFPAEHYMLDIGDHGGGWSGAISDDSTGGWMSTPQIRQALDMAQKETGVKLDIVAFDCCLMATGEVANELKDHTNFMVASQESEGGAGWTYNDVLKDKDGNTLAPQRHSYKNLLMSAEVLGDTQEKLRNRITLEPKEFAMKQVDSAGAHQNDLPTMSAFDLSKMGAFNNAAAGLADAILATSTPNATLKGLAGKTQSFSSGKDAFHFAQLIVKDPTISDPKLKEAAQNLMDAVGEVIIHNEHQEPRYANAHGLNLEIPSYGSVSGKYDELAFNKDVPQWKKAMNKMLGK